MKIAFHTLGCKVNHYETEAIREAFVSRGAETAGEEDFADVYIINTCTVTNIADRKSRQYIRRMKRVNPDALIVVTGCYAQVEPDEVAAMPEVDIVVGNGNKSKICDLVFEKLEKRRNQSFATDVLVKPRAELTEYEDMGMVASGEPGMTRAYIKIQEGCDRFCSYCLIPYVRGPVRSRPAEDILREAVMLLDSGHRELVLTGINTALYGTEAGAGCSLAELLAEFDRLERPAGDDFRIRLSSLEPTVVDRNDVQKIIRFRRLCHHLHLSVQSGSDSILRSMNRHYSRDDYLEIVRAIREFDPLYGITTDIIVGFSGETESDFEDSLDIVRQSGFGKVHVFRYSPRRGTAGAALPDAVPGSVRNERSDRLEQISAEAARLFIEKNIAASAEAAADACCEAAPGVAGNLTVLTEEIKDGYMTGYTGNYIKVYIDDCGGRLQPGQFVKVRLTEQFRDGCKAERVQQSAELQALMKKGKCGIL